MRGLAWAATPLARGALCASLALAAACGGERASDGDIEYPRVKRIPLHATGVIVDNRGKPIDMPGAKLTVAVYGQVKLGDRQSRSPEVGPDGRYDAQIEEGKFSVEAWIRLDYDGMHYKLFLDPLEGVVSRQMRNEAAEGIVTRFRWRIHGARPGANDPKSPYSFYGGQVRVAVKSFEKETPLPPDDAILSMKFAPDGPLIDGSAGEAFEKTCTIAELRAFDTIPDVPLGRWIATGTLQRKGEPRKKLACLGEDGQPKEICVIRFKPSSSVEGFTDPASAIFEEPEFAE